MELIEKSDIPREVLKSVEVFLAFIDLSHLVLVIGAGSGELLEKFKKRGFRVVCVEADKELCQKWQERGFEMIEGTPAKLGTLELPKDIGGIWAGSAFEHISDWDLEHALEVMRLILPNEGSLFLSVPRGKGQVMNGAEITQFYSEDEFRKLLTDRHYNIVHLEANTPSLLTAVVTR